MDSLFGFDKPNKGDESTALLTTVHDNVELSIVRSILEGEGIPYHVKERGSGSSVKMIMGYSMFGSDILVPAAMLDAATELLDDYRNAEAVEEDFDGESELEDEV